jgi:hypothetical protein
VRHSDTSFAVCNPDTATRNHRLESLVVVARAKNPRGDLPLVIGESELKQTHGVTLQREDAIPDVSSEDFREIVEAFRLLHKWRVESQQ